MRSLLAIARLTFKSAFRFRLVPLLAVLLIGTVFLLPSTIKDDGTARGLTQIVLTYTLGITIAVLGLTTLWLACGTLARDIDDCTIQIVVVKPVARWQIWLGKWGGLMLVNLLLLTLASSVIYAQLLWRARRLPPAEQEVLRDEVFTARGSFKEAPINFEPEVQKRYQERLASGQIANMDRAEALKIIRAKVKGEIQEVAPGFGRRWDIDMSSVADKVRNQPLFIRAKFFASEKSPSGNYTAIWEAGPEDSPNRVRSVRSQAAETYYEMTLPPNLLDAKGILHVRFYNTNEASLLFPLEDGFEVLYREGNFTVNYVRGIAVIFCWLALIAAVGLAAASYMSFPVAAFVSLAVLVVVFSTGTMNTIIEQGGIREVNHDTGVIDVPNIFDRATVVFFKGLLSAVNMVKGFSPVDALSSGRSITWGTLARAVGQIVLLIGGFVAAVGIAILNRRELATAQGKS